MVKHDVIKKTLTYTYSEVKQFFDMLNKFVLNEGSSVAFSYAMVKNILMLDEPYRKIAEGLYIPEKDPKVIAYKNAVRELMEKYADRTPSGEIVRDDKNNPVVNTKFEDFKKDIIALDEQNKDTIAKVSNADAVNQEYLVKNTMDVEICTLPDIEQCPSNVPPILLYYMFKDQF